MCVFIYVVLKRAEARRQFERRNGSHTLHMHTEKEREREKNRHNGERDRIYIGQNHNNANNYRSFQR